MCVCLGGGVICHFFDMESGEILLKRRLAQLKWGLSVSITAAKTAAKYEHTLNMGISAVLPELEAYDVQYHRADFPLSPME